jgi:hypothetical protein
MKKMILFFLIILVVFIPTVRSQDIHKWLTKPYPIKMRIMTFNNLAEDCYAYLINIRTNETMEFNCYKCECTADLINLKYGYSDRDLILINASIQNGTFNREHEIRVDLEERAFDSDFGISPCIPNYFVDIYLVALDRKNPAYSTSQDLLT